MVITSKSDILIYMRYSLIRHTVSTEEHLSRKMVSRNKVVLGTDHTSHKHQCIYANNNATYSSPYPAKKNQPVPIGKSVHSYGAIPRAVGRKS